MSDGNYAVVKVWKESGIFEHFTDAENAGQFLKRISGVVKYWATTTFTNADDKWFDTLEDAKDAAEDDDELDWNDDPSGC